MAKSVVDTVKQAKRLGSRGKRVDEQRTENNKQKIVNRKQRRENHPTLEFRRIDKKQKTVNRKSPCAKASGGRQGTGNNG